MRIFCFLVLFIVLFSCKGKKEKIVSKSSFDIEYKTDLNIKNKIHYLKEGKFLSFSDLRSRKRIDVFTLKGKKVKSIDLSPLINKVKILGYDIVSLDSIILLSKYTNKVFLINDKCEVLFKKDYSNLLLKSIELYPPINFENNVLKCGISFSDINFPEKPVLDDYIASNKISIHFPKLFIDSSFDENSENNYHFFLDSISSRFIKKDEVGLEGIDVYFHNDNVYYISAYSDSVYVINNKNELIRVKSLRSENFTLKPSKYKDFIHNMNIPNEEYKKNGFIWSLGANSSGAKFYSVFCKKSNEIPRPFTILIYDKKFNVIDKIEPDPNNFYPFVLMDENGYYILQNKKDKSSKTLTFYSYD